MGLTSDWGSSFLSQNAINFIHLFKFTFKKVLVTICSYEGAWKISKKVRKLLEDIQNWNVLKINLKGLQV